MPRLTLNRRRVAGAAVLLGVAVFTAGAFAAESPTTRPAIPADAKYACPMSTHPDEQKPADRGPYFSSKPGECPRCGMKLKPIDQLKWAKESETTKAAKSGWPTSSRGGEADDLSPGLSSAPPRLKATGHPSYAEVAYTCPDHQAVFSKEPGKCPRCGKVLEPFKLMYTCPDREHAGVIGTSPGRCPRCGKTLVPYRGIWLGESMASANVPPSTQPAAEARYHCPVHPLVHSDSPGQCTICGRELVSTAPARGEPGGPAIRRSATQRTPPPGGPPARGRAGSPTRPAIPADAKFVCPMHPQVRSDKPGTCPICEMQLVRADQLKEPQAAPERVRQQVDHITEHYLAIQRLLASDSTSKLAQQALGVAAASEELLKRLDGTTIEHAAKVKDAAERLRSAAVKMNSHEIAEARVQFVDLSRAAIDLLKHVRPDRKRWHELYIFHCPMSKGDWIQADREIRNPYYGFSMLKCGALTSTE